MFCDFLLWMAFFGICAVGLASVNITRSLVCEVEAPDTLNCLQNYQEMSKYVIVLTLV